MHELLIKLRSAGRSFPKWRIMKIRIDERLLYRKPDDDDTGSVAARLMI
jgi:hypothetical protein